MNTINKVNYLNVHDVMDRTGKKLRQSYYIIEKLNGFYKASGHIPIKGQIPEAVFNEYYNLLEKRNRRDA